MKNNLDRITRSSPTLQMALSELLFEKLWPEKCFHKTWFIKECPAWSSIYICKKCETPEDEFGVINLFTDSAFLTVFRAVKDREGFQEEFGWGRDCLHINTIESPKFQFDLLTWLLEQDNEGERLTKIMEVVKDE